MQLSFKGDRASLPAWILSRSGGLRGGAVGEAGRGVPQVSGAEREEAMLLGTVGRRCGFAPSTSPGGRRPQASSAVMR